MRSNSPAALGFTSIRQTGSAMTSRPLPGGQEVKVIYSTGPYRSAADEESYEFCCAPVPGRQMEQFGPPRCHKPRYVDLNEATQILAEWVSSSPGGR